MYRGFFYKAPRGFMRSPVYRGFVKLPLYRGLAKQPQYLKEIKDENGCMYVCLKPLGASHSTLCKGALQSLTKLPLDRDSAKHSQYLKEKRPECVYEAPRGFTKSPLYRALQSTLHFCWKKRPNYVMKPDRYRGFAKYPLYRGFMKLPL